MNETTSAPQNAIKQSANANTRARVIAKIAVITLVLLIVCYALLGLLGVLSLNSMGEVEHENQMRRSEFRSCVEKRLNLTFPESIQWGHDVYHSGFQDDYFLATFKVPESDLKLLFPESEFPRSKETKPSFLFEKDYDWFDVPTHENGSDFDVDREGHRFRSFMSRPDDNGDIIVNFEWLRW